ncbi:hypothetical protein [Devosia elaeis]|uniref:Uncharacterized protein n=1 Tax=Devosia elaeis TaxID=1770058 RepID=A0A178HKT9_9HYPH|nr:hypothetical protein [Devosia elaeis]OAM73472.1 hypothetical protein A3840_18015 [Devosia elaeis]
MRGLFNFILSTTSSMRGAVARAFDNHVAVHRHPDGWRQGSALYLRLPFTRLSALVERHQADLGRGVERSVDGVNFWLGRVEVHLCREQGELYASGKGMN